MIPANHPYEATYAHEGNAGPDGKPRRHYTTKPVIAWDDDGRALVVGDKGRLVPASTWRNFHDVRPCDAEVIAAIPGGGWIAEYTNPDGTVHTSPIVTWIVRSDGSCAPLDTDGAGYVDTVVSVSNLHRIYHPDTPEGA